MSFVYRPALGQSERDGPFLQMQRQGLLACAMYAFARPTLKDWRCIIAKGLLLRCEDHSGHLLAVGLFTPKPDKLLQFDFTAFRESFALAPRMARGAFGWIFRELDCAGIVGICPLPNRHAWRLAETCGFRVLGRSAGACFYARKGRHVDGIQLALSREDWLRQQKTMKPGGKLWDSEEA